MTYEVIVKEISKQKNRKVMKTYYVYILANKNNNVIYVGMTNNLSRRVYEHKRHINKGFTSKYNVEKLVYYEKTENVKEAIKREKEIKKWRREKKNRLIESMNPTWEELFVENVVL